MPLIPGGVAGYNPIQGQLDPRQFGVPYAARNNPLQQQGQQPPQPMPPPQPAPQPPLAQAAPSAPTAAPAPSPSAGGGAHYSGIPGEGFKYDPATNQVVRTGPGTLYPSGDVGGGGAPSPKPPVGPGGGPGGAGGDGGGNVAAGGSGGDINAQALFGLQYAMGQPTDGRQGYQHITGNNPLRSGSLLGQRILPEDNMILSGLQQARGRIY